MSDSCLTPYDLYSSYCVGRTTDDDSDVRFVLDHQSWI